MKLRSLAFTNFRQFREAAFEFAEGKEKNVTVIHGQNGAGKTTILNALKWLFYNRVDFKNRPDRLATEGAMAEAEITETVPVEVELTFDHDGAKYTATRTVKYRKTKKGDYDGEVEDAELKVVIQDSGQVREPKNPKNVLESVIPERLCDLFFFDGEDIDKLSQFDNQNHVQEAIENIMGLTILERAKNHLDTVSGRFEDEAAEYGSEELEKLIEKKQSTEQKIEKLTVKLNDKQRAVERVDRDIKDCEDRLGRLEDSRALQKQRDKYEDKVDNLEEDINKIEKKLREQVNDSGYITLGMPLIKDSAEDIDELRERGDLPSRLSNEYLDSLLQSKECICGRPLEHRTEPYDRVSSMKGEVSTDGVDQAALRLIGALEQLSDSKDKFLQRKTELINQRREKQEEIRDLNEMIDDIASELQDIDTQTESGLSVQDLEAKREAKTEKKKQLNQKIGRIKNNKTKAEKLLEERKEQIAKERDEEQKSRLARRRQRVAEEVQRQVEQSFEQLKETVRDWSNRRVKQTFEEIASKKYKAGIDDDFSLEIYREDQADERVAVDISRGERQIASLAFIGSLIKIAQERYEEEADHEYFTGGIYSMVMDSPFGALDNEHRKEVSRVIPNLGSQVVVLATDAQWNGPVADQMSDRIGQQYWLDYREEGDKNGQPLTQVHEEQAAMVSD